MILSSLPYVEGQGRAEVAEWQTRLSQKPMRATSCGFDSRSRHHATGNSFRLSLRFVDHQAPPPPPPPPPPLKPPPPKPLELPELGLNAIALEMLAFMNCRLLDRSAAWNGPGPTYQELVALVSMPWKAFAHSVTQPKTIAYGSSCVKMSALAANCWRYFSAVVM